MKTLTLRGIDDILSTCLQQQAKRDNQSVNQLILNSLRQQFGLLKSKEYTQIHHDLDDLFGQWSDETFDKIQGNITSTRQIDAELWR